MNKDYFEKIDLHMHTTISDGTNTPEEIVLLVREKGIQLFSVTDHDAIKGSEIVSKLLGDDSPRFIRGIEFSCKDEEGKYHILGYGYDPEKDAIKSVVKKGHDYRLKKVRMRLDYLKDEFGFEFSEEDIEDLFALDNPGKPHIGNMMVRYGFVETKEEGIKNYINGLRTKTEYIRPEEAIRGIIASGGIPVLAHPTYGDGDQLILGEEMENRLKKLIDFGLEGVEGFYSGFTNKIRNEIIGFADKYNLYVTAGSDYHGKNKLVELGDIGVEESAMEAKGLDRFLEKIQAEGMVI